MQNLASVFVSQGFEAFIVLPQHFHKKINTNNDHDHDNHNNKIIKWVGLEDGIEENTTTDFFAIESSMENIMPNNLEEFLQNNQRLDEVCLMVVDLLASWAIQVANKFSIPTAGFWPAMLSSYLLIAAIPHMLMTGLISDTGLPQHEGKITFVPSLPVVSTEDLPWLIGTIAAKKARFKFWMRTLERSRNLKWVLVNSFPNEIKVGVQTSNSSYSQNVLPIGPIYRPHQLTKNLSFWEEDLSCLKWLKNQKVNSVVYVSFGSWVNPIGESNLKNLALALEATMRPFIWVLRSTWRQGLPIGFCEKILKEGRGMVVSWAPQREILQHNSLGCFITHCGWNSTLEALQFQKKLLCYPMAGDQFVNCAYIVEVWRVGLRLNGLGQKDVAEGLANVMEDKEMSTRLMTLYEIIMGMHSDNKSGSFLLKSFVEQLNEASTIHKKNS
ncbi:UDP-glycosyltransferase 82A1-like protein [Trifolium pratense]|uniref:UDP-glycosyltransferase 82A1-like protein n=1 Tax=Trifolium pratense TaxID=57577 RepID=A0A2K3L423_TRIPR|nr:UDP-glycosyltransferase 82A1-like protein [Trifolium pratense]